MKEYRLDLDLAKLSDTKELVENFIEKYWGSKSELVIITGDNLRKKGIVLNTADRYGFPYQISKLNLEIITIWSF